MCLFLSLSHSCFWPSFSSCIPGMRIGVCSVDEDTETGQVAAWGLRPWDGRLCSTALSRSEETLDAAITSGNLQTCALHKRIEVRVDYNKHTLSFSIDGAAATDSGIRLTVPVKPWLRAYFIQDAFELSSYRDCSRHASPRRRSSPRKVVSRSQSQKSQSPPRACSPRVKQLSEPRRRLSTTPPQGPQVNGTARVTGGKQSNDQMGLGQRHSSRSRPRGSSGRDHLQGSLRMPKSGIGGGGPSASVS